MVNRVSTSGNYSAVLANLMAAQQRQNEYGGQVATQKKGSDLKSFARSADTLAAMRTIHARVKGYQEQNGLIADRLTAQDTALNQITAAAAAAREAIASAVANGRADTLFQELQAHLTTAVEGMNSRYNGKYVFAGGQIDTRPVTATQLSDLMTVPAAAIDLFFQNDDFKAQAKVDDSTTVTTGVLASELGTEMLSALRALQAFQEGPDGPIAGTLTEVQSEFLRSQLGVWDAARSNLTARTASNGLNQQRVDLVKETLASQHTSLSAMIGNVTDADMPLAVSQLQQAQLAVQAAAQVYQTLQSSSLLNILE